jgi:hypothetical protein
LIIPFITVKAIKVSQRTVNPSKKELSKDEDTENSKIAIICATVYIVFG